MSISEIKNKMPKEFIENLYNMFSPVTVDKILIGISNKRLTTLRVNTIKYNIQDLMKYFKEKNIKFERVLWYKDGLIIKNANETNIQKLDIYQKGYIYLQSLSSMVPICVLSPKPNEKVLDLTAAPGSKTTQMAAMMNNEGYILANELDKIRCEKLKYNVDIQGANIVEVINERGEKIGDKYANYFDKVLLDTPCSGEGRFMANNPMTYKSWSIKNVHQLSNMQKKLLKSAAVALKIGGNLVYSTCTLNLEENENIINWAVENLSLKIVETNITIQEALPAFNNGLDKSINKAIRILPSKTMEGFFVCKFIKR